ncbi:MAG: phosphatidylglycerophosphatase A [Alphaproteobacteria bacterium]|nr:phosphatidylglycerophosphatase A [Alphaproteobacteria bacterium]
MAKKKRKSKIMARAERGGGRADWPSMLVGTLLGAGHSPFMPGTFGTAVSLVPIYFAIKFGGVVGLALLAALFYFLGVMALRRILKHSRHDPQFVVIDEAAGMAVALIPFAAMLQSVDVWWIYIAAFVLFRIFDMTKPWPANYFDSQVKTAHGVMLDDIVAGAYAAVFLLFINAYVG